MVQIQPQKIKTMPLLKNGVPYTLTSSDKERIRKEVSSKFPVVLKMPSHWQIKDPNPKNRNRIIRPPGVIIRTKSVIANEGSFDTWQWSRTFTPTNTSGVFRASDSMIQFNTETKIGQNEMDKLFFLLFCTPQRGGVTHSGQNPVFVVEDREKEALSVLDMDVLQASAIHYISKEFTEDRVRKIAAHFNIPGALDIKNVGPAEVRISLINMLKIRKNGFQEFSKIVKLEEEIEISSEIAWLEEQNLLKYIDGEGWILLKQTDDGNYVKNIPLTDVIGQRSPKESLIYFLKSDPKEWEFFKIYSEQRWEDDMNKKEVTKRGPKSK